MWLMSEMKKIMHEKDPDGKHKIDFRGGESSLSF